MYLGNTNLRGPDQKVTMTKKQINEYIHCKEDMLYFAENYFYVVDNDKGKHKIQLREFQKRMLKAFVSPTENKKYCCVLAPRQVGKSTIATIYLTHYILFNEDKTVALLANKEKTANGILRKIKLAIVEFPLWLQQGVSDTNGGWNKGGIGFENGSRLIAGSTSSSAIRSEAISLLYLDEFAHIPDNLADEFMASVYPTISSSKNTKIIIVSTPLGLNHFYHIWRGAIEKDPKKANQFMPIKINWNEVEGRDQKFKDDTIRDIGPKKWAQEFEGKFIGSSSTLIEASILERMEMLTPIDVKLGDCLYIYEQPIEGAMYMLGIDSAKGTGNDFSVVQVLKITHEHDIKQVAKYSNNLIAPHDFAQVCISISEFYNDSYMMLENNEIGSSVADEIWYTHECDKILNIDKKGIGIRSTKTSKLAGNMLLKRYADAGWLEIVDRTTIYELSKYEEIRPNIFQAPRGSNDDHVMALIWAVYFVNTVFFDGKTNTVKAIDDKFKLSLEEKNAEEPIMIYQGDVSVEEDLPEGWGYTENYDDNSSMSI